MLNGIWWLSCFKKEKGEEVDLNFINYKFLFYNFNKIILGLFILYINLYIGVVFYFLKKKLLLILYLVFFLLWMLFEGKWYVYFNNYFMVDGMINIYIIILK